MKIKISPTLLRVGVVLLGLLVVAALAFPQGEAFVAEAQCSRALSKGRVLLRGAQQVATRRLLAGENAAEAEAYLTAPDHLAEIEQAADYPVSATAVNRVVLDEKGLIVTFECAITYDEQLYTLTYDLSAQQASAVIQQPAATLP